MDNIDKLIRNDTAKQYRSIRKLLHGNIPEHDEIQKVPLWGRVLQIFAILLCIGGIAYILILPGCAYGYTVDQYANAIYKAEGGAKTRHPYGILAHYKHTTARQACINTIKHQYNRWTISGRKMPFTAFLGHVYAPIGCSNDVGTNQYWVKNVNWFLMKGA